MLELVVRLSREGDQKMKLNSCTVPWVVTEATNSEGHESSLVIEEHKQLPIAYAIPESSNQRLRQPFIQQGLPFDLPIH
jgi:hypothetical protein